MCHELVRRDELFSQREREEYEQVIGGRPGSDVFILHCNKGASRRGPGSL